MTLDAAISTLFLVVLGVSALAALWHRWRHHAPLGLGVRGVPVPRDLLVGAAIGAGGIALTTALMVATGHARFSGVGFDATILVKALIILGVAAVVEEVAYRVLMLGGLYRLTGSALRALLLSATVFGLVHVTDSTDVTVVSVLSNAVGGLMYGVAFVRTGRIWMAVGLHSCGTSPRAPCSAS